MKYEKLKKFDNTISPVLYMTQQKFNDKLFGMNIEQVQENVISIPYTESFR